MNKSREKEQKNQKIQKILTFGQRLRQVRKDLGLNQSDFAQKLGFSANTIISRFEKDKSIPSVEVLLVLAQDYKIDLHWLLTGQPSPSTIDVAEILTPIVSGYLMQLSEEISSLEFKCKEFLYKKIIPIDTLPADKTLNRKEFRDAEELQRIQDSLKQSHILYDAISTILKTIQQKYLPSP
jgi:transcriptional regulator with XRE-family HTH domain